ncbi:MAG: YjgP/YjgQ family permease, partial [Myxococcales bacterium]|nr:YjgP/YjgQ family permease [Myxococcales bacterium]
FLMVQWLKVSELAFGRDVNLEEMVRLGTLFLPQLAALTVPISVLTGILLGFGGLSAGGELTALCAGGVPPRRLLPAPVALGLMAAMLSWVLGSLLAPYCASELARAFSDLARRQVVSSLIPGRFFEQIPGVVLYPARAGPTKDSFAGFLVHDCRDRRACRTVFSEQAQVSARDDRNALRLLLFEGEVHQRGPEGEYTQVGFARGQIDIDLDWLVSVKARFVAEGERLPSDELALRSRDPARSERERRVLAVAWHRRWAIPLAALLFSIWGTALAAGGKLQGWRRTLVAALLSVAGYYLLLRMGDALAHGGRLSPAAAAWLPDALLAVLVGMRLWRVERSRS